MIVRLMGKHWRWDDAATDLPRTWDGRCDTPDVKRKVIKLRRGLKGERHLEVSLHEMIHACDPTKDEYAVTEMARDMQRVLWRLGYRRVR